MGGRGVDNDDNDDDAEEAEKYLRDKNQYVMDWAESSESRTKRREGG